MRGTAVQDRSAFGTFWPPPAAPSDLGGGKQGRYLALLPDIRCAGLLAARRTPSVSRMRQATVAYTAPKVKGSIILPFNVHDRLHSAIFRDSQGIGERRRDIVRIGQHAHSTTQDRSRQSMMAMPLRVCSLLSQILLSSRYCDRVQIGARPLPQGSTSLESLFSFFYALRGAQIFGC